MNNINHGSGQSIAEPSAITLRFHIQNKVVQQKPDIIFDPADHIILVSSKESDAMDLLNIPMPTVLHAMDLLDIPVSTVLSVLQARKKVMVVIDTDVAPSSGGATAPAVNLIVGPTST